MEKYIDTKIEKTETPLKLASVKAEKQIQITLDEDKNVPDAKIDIEKIILSKADIKIQETEVMVDRIRVNGELAGEILYYGTDGNGRLSVMDFSIPYEEYFHISSVIPTDHVSMMPELEDLNVTMINSRKVGIRAILNYKIHVPEITELNGITDVSGDGVQTLKKELSITSLVVDKKDIVRLREEAVLPANKPNIFEPLWSYIEFQRSESKIYDHKIGITGELYLFLLYLGEEEHMPLQYVEWQIPVRTELECQECYEGMIGNIDYRIINRNLEVKPDADGELRLITAETGLEMNLKIYEEEQLQMVDDIYHWKKELIPHMETFSYQQLVAKNAAVMKINQRIPLRQNRILQILAIDGDCKIDESSVVEQGVLVEGVIDGTILYLTEDDNIPIGSMPVLLPFSYTMEAKGMGEKDHYQIHSSINQLNALFLDGDEIEVKAEITFHMMVLSSKEDRAMTEFQVQELDMNKLQQMPGIVGYVVKPDDSLWKIAKKYYTTIELIKELNPDLEEPLVQGTHLLIMKEIEVNIVANEN